MAGVNKYPKNVDSWGVKHGELEGGESSRRRRTSPATTPGGCKCQAAAAANLVASVCLGARRGHGYSCGGQGVVTGLTGRRLAHNDAMFHFAKRRRGREVRTNR
ncbi:hypothetical protein NL676_011330 [Syzygium grande]|nr:hypothetical protein NL676_011330 [Syzygium grande]